MMTKILATVVLVMTTISSAHAAALLAPKKPNPQVNCEPEPEIEVPAFALGTPSIAGNGCAEDTVGISMTDDKKTVSFIFDNFIAEAGNSVELKRSKKHCRVTIPVDVPKGFQIITIKMDQRGFYSVPKSGSLNMERKYWLANKKNKVLTRPVARNLNVRGPAEDEYTKSLKITVPTLYSPCGQPVKFNLDTTVDLKTNKAGDDALATVDSLDVAANNKGYFVKFFMKKCK